MALKEKKDGIKTDAGDAEVEKVVPPAPKPTLSTILSMITEATDLSWFDVITAKANERKKALLEDEIEAGDTVILSPKCSVVLLKAVKGQELIVESVDRDQRYHLTIRGTETLVDREKLLLIKKKG